MTCSDGGMSSLLCCLLRRDMGAALNHPGLSLEGVEQLSVDAPTTMAEVIRERKKKAGVAGLGTLRRRLAAAARRPRDSRGDSGASLRGIVGSWRPAELAALREELRAGVALRELQMLADAARMPAAGLGAALLAARTHSGTTDVVLVHRGVRFPAHRALLCARSRYFRDLLRDRHSGAVRLESLPQHVGVTELDAVLTLIYGGALTDISECDGECGNDELDIISGERSNGTMCAGAGRAASSLGVQVAALHRDCRYLLDSGEYSDARLVFWCEGSGGGQLSSTNPGGEYGFRPALELPCHRLVLAARSRFFRSVMSRRSTSGGAGSDAVCVDEKVLPRRFARALLHAAYTDQVDLNLIGRSGTTPPSTTNTAAVSGTNNKGSWSRTQSQLEDAFQFYEIASFLEMPVAVQGCEDAIVETLTPDSLSLVLRWSGAPHASKWVHRQAMQYLLDEFVAVAASGATIGQVPRAELTAALDSPFLQAPESVVLRGLLKWGEQQLLPHTEPNVVWHTGHAARRNARRREVSDAALREAIAPLIPLLRVEHIPRACDIWQQAVRRGLVPSLPQLLEPAAGCSVDAWLGHAPYRSPRVYLPYLVEIKLLLEDQQVSEAEVSRARRTRYLHHIPDTLYMVQPSRSPHPHPHPQPPVPGVEERSCVSPRSLSRLRRRVRELRNKPLANRALTMPAADRGDMMRQIYLRTVREYNLPDACADLLAVEEDARPHEILESGEVTPRPTSGGNRSPLPQSESGRSSSCRRELPVIGADGAQNSRSLPRRSTCSLTGACVADRARLSSVVPDVAMPPNANTHLLTARDFCTPHVPVAGFSGGVLQLDLGDGATHTPAPGSRANRAARHHRDRQQMPTRAAFHEDELLAAIELSFMRGARASTLDSYNYQPVSASPLPGVHTGHARSPCTAGTSRTHATLAPYRHHRYSYNNTEFRLDPTYNGGNHSDSPPDYA